MKREICLLLCSMAGVAMAWQAAVPQTVDDAMEIGSRKLAGANGIDCGRVHVGAPPKAATDCAMAAFKAHKPFRVRYELRGIDSAVAAGLAQSSDGKLYGMFFDDNMMDGGSTDISRQTWNKFLCPRPFKVWVMPTGRLNCVPHSPKPSNVMSPTFEQY